MAAATTDRRWIVILISGMLITGASNSLWSKWQDMQCVAHCDNPAKRRDFEQPVWQTLTMFMGESLCLMVFLAMSSRFNPRKSSSSASNPDAPTRRTSWKQASMFWLPSTLDIMGTTCMNVGLLFIPVSIYQMLRGALVLWVALFSYLFLNRKLERHHWISLLVVMLGVGIVGLSSIRSPPKTSFTEEAGSDISPLIGIMFVLGAQIFTATQFVLEEKIMSSHEVDPLAAVGYEGGFGTLTVLASMPILYIFIGRTVAGKGGYFDAPVGFHQIIDNPVIWSSSVAIAISIAFFNFCGLAVTKSVSANARSTIDTCRTLLIWMVSLFLGWEKFKWMQVVGFSLLVYGTFVFNGISTFPAFTGFHGIPVVPAIIATSEHGDDDDDDEEDEDDDTSTLRPTNGSDGSGNRFAPLHARRGEHAPLLEDVETAQRK